MSLAISLAIFFLIIAGGLLLADRMWPYDDFDEDPDDEAAA